MIEQISKNLVNVKKEFVQIYDGVSNIQEIIPIEKSDVFPIEEKFLKLLHLFASKNPIYYNSYNKNISKVNYTVYEGDINRYWLGSISQESSHAPFSPTWIFSAFIATLQAKRLGFKEIVDIGSGDGRIAYCAKILGLDAYSIEIDEQLVELQKSIIKETGFNFKPHCADITRFDFSLLASLAKPVFFIGGLAQMGGTILASSIVENVKNLESKNSSGFVFVGTHSKKYADSEHESGWGKLIEKNNLKIAKILSLPTAWTWREPEDTPYIFTKFDV